MQIVGWGGTTKHRAYILIYAYFGAKVAIRAPRAVRFRWKERYWAPLLSCDRASVRHLIG